MFACPQAIMPINGENRMPVGVKFVVEMQFSAAIPKRRVRPTRRSDIVRGMGRRGRGNSRCDSLWAHRCKDRPAARPAGPFRESSPYRHTCRSEEHTSELQSLMRKQYAVL